MEFSTIHLNERPEAKEKESEHSSSNDEWHISIDHETHIPHSVVVNKNGIRVHPQPTADKLDPLNWPRTQKHTILAIVMFK